jgi:hypothetical protein
MTESDGSPNVEPTIRPKIVDADLKRSLVVQQAPSPEAVAQSFGLGEQVEPDPAPRVQATAPQEDVPNSNK